MVKTKQTKRKSETEKERRNKYRTAKSRFGTAAKVATHNPPRVARLSRFYKESAFIPW